ncbi:MAG: helix-turn-helix transcriptional regulator [Desulfotalea sp.]
MKSTDFKKFRKNLEKTQKEMSILLSVSLKAVSSYEQGWRKIPSHIERQVLYMLSHTRKAPKLENCWKILKCPAQKRKKCPAWEFRSGARCWAINGTICQGKHQSTWEEKITYCHQCKVMKQFLDIDKNEDETDTLSNQE